MGLKTSGKVCERRKCQFFFWFQLSFWHTMRGNGGSDRLPRCWETRWLGPPRFWTNHNFGSGVVVLVTWPQSQTARRSFDPQKPLQALTPALRTPKVAKRSILSESRPPTGQVSNSWVQTLARTALVGESTCPPLSLENMQLLCVGAVSTVCVGRRMDKPWSMLEAIWPQGFTVFSAQEVDIQGGVLTSQVTAQHCLYAHWNARRTKCLMSRAPQ